jgi:hypothetical protein
VVGASGITTNTPITLDTSESGTILVPINTFLSDNEIPISALDAPVIVRIWFKTGSYIADTGLISISSATLLADSWEYSAEIRHKQIGKFQSSKLDYRVLTPKFQRTIETITPNTVYNLRLSSVQGIVSSMTVILRLVSSGATLTINSLDLLTPSGASMLGGQLITHQYLQAIQRAKEHRFVPNTGESALVSDQYFRVPISEYAQPHSSMGGVNGYFVSDGYNQLSFLYSAGNNTPVACEITVLYDAVSTVSLTNGKTSIAYS